MTSFDEPVPQRLATGLAKIAVAVRHQERAAAGANELTATQALVLRMVSNESAGVPVSDLAHRLAVTVQTVSDSVAALDRKGLVARRPDEDDRRVVRVTATQAGVQTVADLDRSPDALLASVGELSPDEQRVLLRVVVKLIRGLQQRGEMPVARVCATCRFFAPYAHANSAQPHHCHFVDAPFGEAQLQTDCADHRQLANDDDDATWLRFVASVGAHPSS